MLRIPNWDQKCSTALEFTHDGTGVLTNDSDKSGLPTGPICRWDIGTGRLQRKYDAPEKIKDLSDLAMTADRKLLALAAEGGSGKNSIALLNLAAGCNCKELALPFPNPDLPMSPCSSLAFSPDDAMLAAGLIFPTHIMIWNTATDAVKTDLPIPATAGFVGGLTFSPDGTRLAAIWRTAKKVVIWNTADWSITQQIDLPGNIGNLEFSPDGRWLSWVCSILESRRPNQRPLYCSSLTTLELATGKTREIRTKQDESINAYIWYSPDSRLLAAAYDVSQKIGQESIVIFDAATGEKKSTLKPPAQTTPEGRILLYGFTPDSTSLIGKDNQGVITIWNVNTGEVTLSRKMMSPRTGMMLIGGGKAMLSQDSLGVHLWDTQQLLSEENPLPRATFNWFDGGKWLITTPQGYFDCSPELTGSLDWTYAGKLYPYQQFEQQYHKPELVRQALSW